MALARSDSRHDSGFTLLELLVVLVIIAAAAAIVLPSFSRSSGTELRAAASALAAGLRKTRSSAITHNRSEALVLDVDRRVYEVPGDGRVRRLPSSVEISLFTARSELVDREAGAIRFFADGSSTGGRITVGSAGRTLLVDVDWLTGLVRIVDPTG